MSTSNVSVSNHIGSRVLRTTRVLATWCPKDTFRYGSAPPSPSAARMSLPMKMYTRSWCGLRAFRRRTGFIHHSLPVGPQAACAARSLPRPICRSSAPGNWSGSGMSLITLSSRKTCQRGGMSKPPRSRSATGMRK